MSWSDASEASRRRRPGAAGLVAVSAVVTAVALLASGCGGSSGPRVANLGSASTTTTSAGVTTAPGAAASSGPGAGSAQSGQFRIAMNVGNAAQGRKFSSCMRKHGVQNFPDPNGQGLIQISSGMGIDPNSPAFQSAQSACRKLLPNGGQPTPAQQAQMQQQMLKFARCMRSHGIKDFPDPNKNGLQVHVTPGSDLDPNNPQFQAAQQACQADLPGKLKQKFGAGPAPGAKQASGAGGG